MKEKNKRGDTLIEVILAVGIFSMVAIAVLAVMSSGASSAQLSLEATLAREEVDAQAEALRFIQNAYIAERSRGNADGKYGRLWKRITGQEGDDVRVVTIDSSDVEVVKAIEQFNPNDCGALYSGNGEAIQYGFAINTGKLGSNDLSDVLVLNSSGKLKEATTYPRLVYGDDDGGLMGNGFSDLESAEGIYIVAVKDPGTSIVGSGSVAITPAYYDFYIRACWYGSGEKNVSTIYTLVRLGDPKSGSGA